MARMACWTTPFLSQAEEPLASFFAGRPKRMHRPTPASTHSRTAPQTLSSP